MSVNQLEKAENNQFRTSRFRAGLTSRSGSIAARIHRARVIDTNNINWTVDVTTVYESQTYLDVPVSTPYVHFNSGEGFSVMPEIGAVCYICLPSDSSAPFIVGFVMPMERIETASEEAPYGTRSNSTLPNNAVDAAFSGGRPRAKPGDIMLSTRNGGYLILHRGGVVQIGAGPTCQRVFVPIKNMMMDVVEQYHMHTTGGSLNWTMLEGPNLQDIPTKFDQTFRLSAADKYCDVRISAGKVAPLGEPGGDAGELTTLTELGIGTGDNVTCYEVTVAKGGFLSDGSPVSVDTKDTATFRYFVDTAGGLFVRGESSALLRIRKTLRVKAEKIELAAETTLSLTAVDGMELNGGKYTHIKGEVVRFGSGTIPMAAQGDIVTIPVPIAVVQGLLNGQPFVGTLQLTTPLTGTILSGRATVLG